MVVRLDEAMKVIADSDRRRVGPKTSLVPIDGAGGRTWETAGRVSPPSGMDRNLYSLARCVASEANPRDAPRVWLAIAEAVRNAAARGGRSIHDLLVNRTNKYYRWTRGSYGIQKGRWASTARDANRRSLTAARIALEHSTNVSNSAVRWLDPKLFAKGYQRGTKLRPLSEVLKRWRKDGFTVCNPPEISQENIMLFCHRDFRIASIGPRIEPLTEDEMLFLVDLPT